MNRFSLAVLYIHSVGGTCVVTASHGSPCCPKYSNCPIDGQVWLLIFPEFPVGWVVWVHLMLGSQYVPKHTDLMDWSLGNEQATLLVYPHLSIIEICSRTHKMEENKAQHLYA